MAHLQHQTPQEEPVAKLLTILRISFNSLCKLDIQGAMVINPIFEKNERGQKHPLEVLESETVSYTYCIPRMTTYYTWPQFVSCCPMLAERRLRLTETRKIQFVDEYVMYAKLVRYFLCQGANTLMTDCGGFDDGSHIDVLCRTLIWSSVWYRG